MRRLQALPGLSLLALAAGLKVEDVSQEFPLLMPKVGNYALYP
jgi:hypothetical protein